MLMNHDSLFRVIRRVLFVGLLGGAIIAIVVLLFHVRAQSIQIDALESRVASLQAHLDTYGRTLCSNQGGITSDRTTQRYTLTSAGYDRTYRVDTPRNYDASVRYPVIISFDGIEGSGDRMEGYAKFDTLPAIMVYPDSLPGKRGYTAWQGAPYSVDSDRDMTFIRDLLTVLPSQYCIDTTQQFAVGMSNGGSFATMVGCELSDQIRAVASVSGAFYTTCQQEKRTPSLLVMHSMSDGQVPFMGETKKHLPKIQQWVSDQATQRTCQTVVPATTVEDVTYYDWRDCADQSLLRFVVVQNQPHGWLAVPATPHEGVKTTADYIWKFFQDSMYF